MPRPTPLRAATPTPDEAVRSCPATSPTNGLPNHQIELTTRPNYRYVLDKHILPAFGGYKMIAIQPADIRAWLTTLKDAGVKPATVKCCLSVLSAIFTTAFNDQITTLLTLLGDIGPWSERIYLAGGLAPRYLIGTAPEGVPAHVGTTDVDLVIGLALGDTVPETYRTLETTSNAAAS